MLAALPPHKRGQVISPLEDRLAMIRLAIHDEPAFEISRVDIDRPGPHYTLDTLNLLRQQNTGSQLILVIGGDSLRDLPEWHRPADVLAACDEIGVMRRPGDDIDLTELETSLPGLIERISFVDAPLLEISSSEIRERVRQGLTFKYYVPHAVHQFIVDHYLYRTP